MKFRSFFAVIVLAVIFSGCAQYNAREGVKVQLPAGGHLPKEIAGTWKAENSDWQITFDQYGNAESAIHHMSGALIKPAETTSKPFIKTDGLELYGCGPWEMTYLPETRDLTIEFSIVYMTQDCPAIIEGTMEETLKGAFNEDFTEWQAHWFNNSDLNVTEPISGRTIKTGTPEDKRDKGKLYFVKVVE